MSIAAPSTDAGPSRETHVYKVVEGCEIKADVFGASVGAKKPGVVWIHGGGLIFGSRTSPRGGFLAALLRSATVVVSIDHRLAPETKLPDVVEDLRDAWRWVREQGPTLLGIDPARLGMAGGSSGGYLTLMSGFCVDPRPRALASFCGFGDITTPWEAEPSAFYRERPLVSKEQAQQSVGTSALSEPTENVDRAYFYLYCRQQGLWPIEVAGHDPRNEPRWFDGYCPIRNVTASYPPTILIHGTADMDVPYEESKNMAARLAEAEVEHDLVTLEGAGHGLAGARAGEAESAETRAAAFLQAHLR
jgi:acetyl esterase/lipase